MTDRKINFPFFIIVIVAVFITWIIHEFAHWLTSEILGYETIMGLNGTSPEKGEVPSEWHRVIISASGPIVTIVQGIVAFMVLRNRYWHKGIYVFLFIAFYMRFLAGIMNFVNLNDEGRIGNFLGIGTFTLPFIVCSFLFFLVFQISKRYELSWKFQLWTTFFVMLISSILILSDQIIGIRII